MASGHAGDAMGLDQAMIVAGVGCQSGASAREIEAAIGAALSQAGVANGALGLIATSSAKTEEPGLAAVATDRGLKVVFVPQADLEAAGSRTLTHSERVLRDFRRAVGLRGGRAGRGRAGRAAARAARRGRSRDLRARGHGRRRVTVHFIGAGPGAADLITVRGRDLIARCPVCLYAGSIVPKELLQFCPPGARIVDTAPMSLDEIEAEFVTAHRQAAGRGAAALRRSFDLQRARRADPAARPARHSLHRHARRSGLRRGRRSARPRADGAGD